MKRWVRIVSSLAFSYRNNVPSEKSCCCQRKRQMFPAEGQGEGGGWEMNGAARCCRQQCHSSPSRLRGVGPGEAGPPLYPGFTLWDPGGGPGPRSRRGVGFSVLLLAALPPPLWAAPPKEMRGRWGWSPSPGHRALLSLRTPSCRWV